MDRGSRRDRPIPTGSYRKRPLLRRRVPLTKHYGGGNWAVIYSGSGWLQRRICGQAAITILVITMPETGNLRFLQRNTKYAKLPTAASTTVGRTKAAFSEYKMGSEDMHEKNYEIGIGVCIPLTCTCDNISQTKTRFGRIYLRTFYSAPNKEAEYCDDRVCLSVGAFACPEAYLQNDTCDLYRIFMHVTYVRGSVATSYVFPCFMEDVGATE